MLLRPNITPRLEWRGILIMLLMLQALLTVLFVPLAKTVPFNSDDASVILEARDAFAGDWLLRKWHLSTESYYTTDVIFYILAIPLFGFSDKLLYIVPSALYAAMVLLASLAAGTTIGGGFSRRGAFVVFVLLVAYSRAYEIFLRGPIHAGGMVYVLACLILLHYQDSYPRLFTGLFAFLLTLGVVGDSFVLYYFVVPLLVVQSLEFLRGNRLTPSFYSTALALLMAFGITKFLNYCGLQVHGLGAINFLSADKLAHNLNWYFHGLLHLYNLYFFGQPLKSLTTLRLLVYAIIMVTVLFCVYRSLLSGDYVKKVLATSCILVSLAYILSTRPEDILSCRYLAPVFVFSIILTGKYTPALLDNQRKAICAILLFSIVVAGFGNAYVQAANHPYVSEDETKLISFLKARNLTTGYGGFWSSNIITLKTNEQIKIYAVVYDSSSNAVKPYLWLSKNEWYSQPVSFLVIDKKRPAHNMVNYQDAVRYFGPPQELYFLAEYTILVWDKDISQDIAL